MVHLIKIHLCLAPTPSSTCGWRRRGAPHRCWNLDVLNWHVQLMPPFGFLWSLLHMLGAHSTRRIFTYTHIYIFFISEKTPCVLTFYLLGTHFFPLSVFHPLEGLFTLYPVGHLVLCLKMMPILLILKKLLDWNPTGPISISSYSRTISCNHWMGAWILMFTYYTDSIDGTGGGHLENILSIVVVWPN